MVKKFGEKHIYGFFEIFSSCILALAVCISLVCSFQIVMRGYVSIAGYSVFKVATGSMEPTISVNALLICDSVDIEDVVVGDIVCFESLSQQMRGSVVTHRVTEIENLAGFIRLKTRGDANTVEDTLSVAENNLIGKVVWYSEDSNIVTNVISFLSGKIGFLAVIVLPVLLVCALILRDNMRKIQQEMRELERLQLAVMYAQKAKKEQVVFFAIDEDEEMESEEELRARLRAEIRKELGLDDPKE